MGLRVSKGHWRKRDRSPMRHAANTEGGFTFPGGRLLLHLAALGNGTALCDGVSLCPESLSPRQALICGENHNPKYDTQTTSSCKWCPSLSIRKTVIRHRLLSTGQFSLQCFRRKSGFLIKVSPSYVIPILYPSISFPVLSEQCCKRKMRKVQTI